MATAFPDRNVERLVDTLTRSSERKDRAQRNAGGRRTIRLRFPTHGYAEIGLQRCPILVGQNKSHRASLFG